MKIVIDHGKTKRAISGPFAFCISKSDLLILKDIINDKLDSNFEYGWIEVDEQQAVDDDGFVIIKRQQHRANTPPIDWAVNTTE